MTLSQVNEKLSWRAAVKQFDTSKKVSEEQIEALLKSINLAPSSFGLQPYHFYVVSDDATKQELGKAGYNQPQFTTASHLIIFASDLQTSDEDVEKFVDNIVKTRGVSKADVADYEQSMKGSMSSKSADELENWAARQVYIPVGVLMTAASVAGIDSSPMEGFDSAQVSNIIGATEKGFKARAIVALGYRSEDDDYSKMAKVRKPLAEIVTKVSQ